jgi:hypothetical protein
MTRRQSSRGGSRLSRKQTPAPFLYILAGIIEPIQHHFRRNPDHKAIVVGVVAWWIVIAIILAIRDHQPWI